MGLEANIRHVTPYVPGEQPRQKVIKLNTNENPYPPAPGAMEMLHQMDPEKLRMYPDPEIKMLPAVIRCGRSRCLWALGRTMCWP